ncbi:hypothetical protein [Streptomyces sp. NPDC003006]
MLGFVNPPERPGVKPYIESLEQIEKTIDYAVTLMDGWSHEKATMATDQWSAEDIERMRLELLVRANGADKVVEMVRRGTWPVDA